MQAANGVAAMTRQATDDRRSEARARRTRVCLVGPSLDIIGGQSVILERLRARMESSADVEVAFLPVNPRLPGPLRALQRVKFVRTIVTSVAYAVSLLRTIRHADVVHAFSASYWSYLLAPVPAMLVGRLFGKAVVLNYHSGEADDHFANWRSAKFFARSAHVVAVPSGYLVDILARHGIEAVPVLNFVEIDAIQYRRRSVLHPRFLSNRNLEPLYNVACTIRAFALVQQEVPDAELVIAGDGSQRGELERLVAKLGLRQVRFVGRTAPAEMPRLYEAADVYLNSPDIDNMPSSIIEAFAAGVPVVTTDAGGIPYIVRHEENGLMVARGDATGMAREALRLLRDPTLAARLSEGGRADCVERYVWAAVRPEWLRVYDRAMRLAASHNDAAAPVSAA